MRNRLHVALLLTLGCGISASASDWSSGTFNTNNGWIRNDALAYEVRGEPETGQNYDSEASAQWYTDDPFSGALSNGATSILRHIAAWTFGTSQEGHNSVLFGGYGLQSDILPGIASPSIYRSFSAFDVGERVVFTVDFGLIPSSGSYPNEDRFGFNLLNGDANVSLAKIVFDPAASVTGPSGIGMQWISDGVTNSIAQIAYGALYRMTATLEGSAFDLEMAGLAAQTNGIGVVTNYVTTSSFLLVSGGDISGDLTAADFQTVSMDWDLASGDPATPGDNYLLVNNVSVVPEPSTYALLAMASLGAAYFVRRRSRR
jgi:hypothetical protein